MWFAVMAVAAFGGFWYVLLMTTFGCDSGWDGCVGVGETTWLVYVGVCVIGLVGVLVGVLVVSLVSASPGVRIAAMCLMPAVVIVAFVVATALYFGLASWLA
jgi:hypothetical protein